VYNVEDNLVNGTPIVVDSLQIESVGCIEYGNNDFWEVLCPSTRPASADGDFFQSDYPVFLMEHQNYPHTVITLREWFDNVPNRHVVTAIRQLGSLLTNYDGQYSN